MATVHRIPFLCIESRWQTRVKWLWDAFAAENETYLGYIEYWDSAPWQRVAFDDGETREFNYAAPAQYFPTYAGESLGSVLDLAALLERDGIIEAMIEAQYNPLGARTLAPLSPLTRGTDTERSEMSGGLRTVQLGDLLFRDFNRRNSACPIVFSRPMTYTKGAPGHIGDNSMSVFFATADETCDGTVGLRGTLSGNNRREFWADAIWFVRNVGIEELNAELAKTAEMENTGKDSALSADSALNIPENAHLVVYLIAAGSVPRISINDVWHVVSPEYMPSYGDP